MFISCSNIFCYLNTFIPIVIYQEIHTLVFQFNVHILYNIHVPYFSNFVFYGAAVTCEFALRIYCLLCYIKKTLNICLPLTSFIVIQWFWLFNLSWFCYLFYFIFDDICNANNFWSWWYVIIVVLFSIFRYKASLFFALECWFGISHFTFSWYRKS